MPTDPIEQLARDVDLWADAGAVIREGTPIPWGGPASSEGHNQRVRRFAALVAAESGREAIDLLRWALGELAIETDDNTGCRLFDRYYTDEGVAKLTRAIELTGFKEPT